MNYDRNAYYKLLDLYKQRDLLIFLEGHAWFDNRAIELLKQTVRGDYPQKDWHQHLLFWEIDHDMIKLE